MAKRVTMQDVANKVGVSKVTMRESTNEIKNS